MLGAIESLLSAVVSDRMSGDRHDPNVELTAQGIANVVSPLFGGLPATGAIARTATNIRSGARTPIAGMTHALTLLLILLFAAPLARHIPLAILAGILMIVAYDMGEWREIPEVVKLGPAEAAVWFITFALTVFADLTVAVEAGMVLAALLYIRRVTTTTTVALVTPEYINDGRAHSLQLHDIPDDVAIYRIHGPFLFGATDKLADLERDVPTLPKVVILRLRNMTAIDGTGLHALEHFADVLHASGRTLILCGMRDQPARMMERAEFHRAHRRGEPCPDDRGGPPSSARSWERRWLDARNLSVSRARARSVREQDARGAQMFRPAAEGALQATAMTCEKGARTLGPLTAARLAELPETRRGGRTARCGAGASRTRRSRAVRCTSLRPRRRRSRTPCWRPPRKPCRHGPSAGACV